MYNIHFKKLLYKNFSDRWNKIASNIRRNKYSTNVHFDKLVDSFVYGTSYSVTSSNRSYYILGNENNRYLVYKNIPVCYFDNNFFYINSNFGGEVPALISSAIVSLGKRPIPISTLSLIEEIRTDSDIDISTGKQIQELYNERIEKYSFNNKFSSEVARPFEKFLTDYLKESPVSPELNRFRGILKDIPDLIISPKELSVIQNISSNFSSDVYAKLFEFITENFIESYYDLAVFSIINSLDLNFEFYKSKLNDLDSVDKEKFINSFNSFIRKFNSAESYLSKYPDLLTSAKNLYSSGYKNFFTQFMVSKNESVFKDLINTFKDYNSTQLVSGDPSSTSKFLDKLNQWKNSIFSKLRSMLHKKMVEEAVTGVPSQGIKPIFSSKIASKFEEQYNKFILEIVDNIMSNSDVQENLRKLANTSDILYAKLLGDDGSATGNVDQSRYFDLFKQYLIQCLTLNLNIGYAKSKNITDTGLYSSVEKIATLTAFSESVLDKDFNDMLSKGYIWCGFDMKESFATYMEESGTIEIPLGFTKYFSRGEAKRIAGYGEILRFDFSKRFMRVSTRSFFAKLIGNYDEEVIGRLLEKKVQLNRSSKVETGKVLKSSSIKSSIAAEASTNKKIRKINDYLNTKTNVMFVLTKDGNVVSMEQMSGEEYYKIHNIKSRGFLLHDLKQLINVIQSGKNIAIYGQQDARLNPEFTDSEGSVKLTNSFVLADLRDAYNRLEKYIDKMHEEAQALLASGLEGKSLTPNKIARIQYQSSRERLLNSTYIVIEMAVGDLFQYSVYRIYPILQVANKEILLTESSAYFRRVTPNPMFVSVSTLEGLDNSAEETLKLFRKSSVLYSKFMKEYNKKMKDLGLSIELEEKNPEFIPMGTKGVVTSELNSVIERLGDYLGYIPREKSPLLAIDVTLPTEETEGGSFTHRVVEDDFFNNFYRATLGADLKSIFTLLSEINELNVELFSLIGLRSENLEVEVQKGRGKVETKTLSDIFGSEFQNQFGSFVSDSQVYDESGKSLQSGLILVISNALKRGIATINDLIESGGIIGKYEDKKRVVLSPQQLEELFSKYGKSVEEVIQDIYNNTYNTIAEHLQKSSGSVDYKLNPVFNRISEVSGKIREKSVKLISILNKYRNEKGALFDLIKSMRVLTYLLSSALGQTGEEMEEE